MGMKSIKNINYLSVVAGIGLFVLPLFYLPHDLVPFEVPKVKFLFLWSLAIAVLVLVRVIKQREIVSFGKKQWLVLSWLVALIITSLFGVDTVKSFLGNYFRWDGIFTYLSLVGMFLALSMVPAKTWLNGATWGIALGNIGSCLWATWQMLTKTGVGFDGYGAGFGQPVFLAGYLVVSVPFVWLLIRKINSKNRRIVLYAVSLSLLLSGLWATKALTALVCLPVLLLLFVFDIRKKSFWWGAVVVIFLAALVLRMYGLEMKKGAERGSGLVYEGRERILMKSYLAFVERPMGYGVANFDRAFESVDWPIKINDDVYVDKAHSNIVEMFVTSGLIGGGLYLLIIGLGIRQLLAGKGEINKFLLMSLVVYVIHSQTNVTSVAEEVIFWLSLSVAKK